MSDKDNGYSGGGGWGTGLLFTHPQWTDDDEAKSLQYKCPLCRAHPGEPCRKTPAPHVARIEEGQRAKTKDR